MMMMMMEREHAFVAVIVKLLVFKLLVYGKYRYIQNISQSIWYMLERAVKYTRRLYLFLEKLGRP